MSKVICVTPIPNDDDPRTPPVMVGEIYTVLDVFKKGLPVIWRGRNYILHEDYFSFVEFGHHDLYAASHFAEVSDDFTFEEKEVETIYVLELIEKDGTSTRLGTYVGNPFK